MEYGIIDLTYMNCPLLSTDIAVIIHTFLLVIKCPRCMWAHKVHRLIAICIQLSRPFARNDREIVFSTTHIAFFNNALKILFLRRLNVTNNAIFRLQKIFWQYNLHTALDIHA